MEIEQNIFFDEFKNKLISLENSLIDVQSGNYSKEDINEIFRSIHTIKGTADLLGMFQVVALTHKAEDILEYVRQDKLTIDTQLCTLLMDLKNFISVLVENVSQGIFDDDTSEHIFIEFEKEFAHIINIAENAQYEYPEIKTILVIDDAALTRYMIKKIATDEGYNVLTSDNPEDGWNKINENAVDLLFCDFSSPNEKAMELVEMLKIDSSTKNLPIVMLLSKNHPSVNQLGKSISAKAWLGKPIEENKLKLILKKLLAKN
ncbi:MAG: response regulator [Arcobacteraceae bacterium]